MKKLLSIVAVLLLIGTTSCAGDGDKSSANTGENSSAWIENFEQAVAKAKDENKTVLVNFTGSDWCPWCIKLSGEVFSKEEFINYANDNLVLVKIDFPRKTELPADKQAYNKKLADKYGIRGLPTVVLFDKDGNVLQQTGYREGGATLYVDHLKGIINKG